MGAVRSAWTEGGDDPTNHVYRGGAFDNNAASLRSAIRCAGGSGGQPLRSSEVGFRIVVEALEP